MAKRMVPRDRSRIFRDCVLYMDVLAETATKVRAGEDLSVALPITFTIDAQLDVPRTLKWAFVSHAVITAYKIVIRGIDAQGNRRIVTLTQNDGWSGETDVAFGYITSIQMTERTGAGSGDTMNIGTGSKLGLPNSIAATANIVIKKNQANWPSANYTAYPRFDTVDVSVGGAISAWDDLTFWYDAF